MQERLAFLSRSLVAPVVRNMPGKFSSPNAVAMLLATGWAMSQFGDRDGSWFHIPLPVAEDLLKNYIELSRQWLEIMTMGANSNGGLQLGDEPTVSAPVQSNGNGNGSSS